MQNKTILIGLGNPILGDDGVGWKVIEYLQQHSSLPNNVETDCFALGGISLMERMIGYDRVILVDAIVTGEHKIGHVLYFEIEDLPNPARGHLTSSHDTSLQVALQMGRSLGVKLPKHISIIAIESQNIFDFTEELTPSVSAAIPIAADWIVNILAVSQKDDS